MSDCCYISLCTNVVDHDPVTPGGRFSEFTSTSVIDAAAVTVEGSTDVRLITLHWETKAASCRLRLPVEQL